MRVLAAVAILMVSAAPARATTAAVEDGTLLIVGTPGDDAVTVMASAGRAVAVGGTSLRLGAGCVAGVCRGVTAVSVQLRSGDDTFSGDVPATVDGGSGRDVLRGGSGPQLLRGGSGRDRLVGGRGHDLILSGSGRDRVDARDGQADRVDCGRSRDRVTRDRDLDTLSRCR